MPLLCDYTSNTSGTEFDKILRYFETTIENILFDDNKKRVSKLSQTLKKIKTLCHLAKASKYSRDSEVQINEPRTKKAKMEKLDLPNEIWLKIINQMNTKDVFQNFSLVCKRFHNLATDASALNFMTIKNTSQMTVETMENVKKVLQRSKQLKELELKEDRRFDPYTILRISFESCPQLKALNLIGYGWNYSMLDSDFNWQTNVQHVRLSINDGIGVYIASKSTNLRSLTVDAFKSKMGGLTLLAQDCKKLERVTIGTLTKWVVSQFNEFLSTVNESLKYLTVEKFEVYDPLKPVHTNTNTYKLFLDNFPSCKILQEVNLDATSLDGHDLLTTISKMPKLQKVELKNLGKLDNEDIQLLAQNCKELKYLKFDNCQSIHLEDKTVLSFIENCPQLTKLSIHWAMVSKISNEIWHTAITKSIDVFITIGKKTFTIQTYLNMIE